METWHTRVAFGVHHDLHAGAQDTLLGAELTAERLKCWLEQIRPDWVQCDCKGHPGYTSWPTQTGSASPGIVRDALRIYRDVTRDMGIPLVMHYSGVWDARAVELHPDWARVAPPVEGDHPHNPGATCNLSPYTDELMIPQMLEVIDTYDVDGFWVDGECWATYPCYCARCREEYTRRTGQANPPLQTDDPDWDGWADFHRALFVEHVQRYTDAVRKRKPACTVVSNWMYTVGHPEAMTHTPAYLSGDFTHIWGAESAALEARFMQSRGLDWDLMAWGFTNTGGWGPPWTHKPAVQLTQEVSAALALGGAVSLYDVPQRTGWLTGWHVETVADVARFVRSRADICRHSQPVREAAILLNSRHLYALGGESLMPVGGPQKNAVAGALQCLLEAHLQTEVMNEHDLVQALPELSLLVIPEQTRLPSDLVDRIAAAVRHGLRVLATGAETMTQLAELAGIELPEPAADRLVYLPSGRQAAPVQGRWQPITPTDAAVWMQALDGPDTAHNQPVHPAIVRRSISAGQVWCIPGPVFERYRDTRIPWLRTVLISMLETALPVNRRCVQTDAPHWLQVVMRRQSGRLIIHCLNQGFTAPAAPAQGIIEELPDPGRVRLKAPVAEAVSHVERCPSGAPLQWTADADAVTVEFRPADAMDSVVVHLQPQQHP